MNLLTFDTGTDAMSIAVARTVDGRVQQWQHSGAGGAQASSTLIPAVLDVLRQAGLRLDALDAIGFGSGPGSFTGLRTACSVAQGLAFGADVPVLPVDSLLAVAEEARVSGWAVQPRGVVTALLDARMDELYVATYAFADGQWSEVQDSCLVRPEDVLAHLQALQRSVPMLAESPPWALAGNVFAEYGDRLGLADSAWGAAPRIAALTTAAAMLRLAPQLLAAGHAVAAQQALPRYIRDKVAKTTLERAAEKAAALAATGQ
ncbi:MAG: tRNA (adenosine(37)-N6)-threonylcarbamoyltransferase complex dimerization subunit type 1 TsaB [Rhodoferax sp.]